MTMSTNYCQSVSKIISGGQTGADRAGLDFAIEVGIEMGGWCPKGRKAEDGRVPDVYPLVETSSADYLERTRLNVENSDGTLVVFLPPLKGGSARTVQFAQDARKHSLVVQCTREVESAAADVRRWIESNNIRTLNVAGSRESRIPGIHDYVVKVLRAAFEPA